MCGICGKVNFDRNEPVSPGLMRSMADTIHHRGPDDAGYYFSGPAGLGFRRLAIIDLNTGHQPLSNEDGTVWIVFNGEIYNYKDLRSDLQSRGHVFTTQTDTEVIVHLYEEYGEGCVEMLRGMFGFAIWDDRHQTLFLARDRVGVKPMYYHLSRRSLVFGSEIKAILADPDVTPEVHPGMIDRFLSFYYLPGEDTLFRNVLKLAPGAYLLMRAGKVTVKRYWDLNFAPRDISLQDAEERLIALLEESVQLHMISDVPVGFLLSGGVDSTAMLGLASAQSDQTFHTFTLGFSEPNITDERPYARLAARTYGSKHHELTITAKQFQDFLPQYVWHMEEPVCEPPAIALYYVSRLAKEFVKVLISGEGGDEAFAGYQNYRSLLWLERLKRTLGPLNGVMSGTLGMLNRSLHSAKIAKFAPLLGLPMESYYYSRTSSPFTYFNSRAAELYSADFAESTDKLESTKILKALYRHAAGYDDVSKMLYIDSKTWLTDDLLLKADKMTMANSIELRVPLLDHKVLEFAASLPSHFKVRHFTTKYIAKKVLGGRVPSQILNRRKTGFPVPYSAWFRRDLRPWLWDILLDRTTLDRGYFQKKGIERLLSENERSGTYSKELFSLATLELWHRTFVGPVRRSEPQSVEVFPDLVP
jgi:asparagine synthase (glutamine-hydrolysing)